MNGNKLLDTNVLIYLSKGELHLSEISTPNEELHISVITYMEALGYQFDSTTEEIIINKLCSNLKVIPLSDKIVQKVIEIKKSKKIKLPDAIISAKALIWDQALVTRNVSDFLNIDDKLKIIDPF